MLCYRYVAPTGLFRQVCAQRIVAQRANILVASRRPRKTRWPCRGRRPRINNVLHRCGLPICRPYGALTTLARRCLATNMSPLRDINDAGAAMFCYRYVAPLGLWRRWRGDVWLPICRPAGAMETLARRCLATDMSPRWGFEDAGAAMVCYRYVALLGLARPFG
jgi:hypothetical protein